MEQALHTDWGYRCINMLQVMCAASFRTSATTELSIIPNVGQYWLFQAELGSLDETLVQDEEAAYTYDGYSESYIHSSIIFECMSANPTANNLSFFWHVSALLAFLKLPKTFGSSMLQAVDDCFTIE